MNFLLIRYFRLIYADLTGSNSCLYGTLCILLLWLVHAETTLFIVLAITYVHLRLADCRKLDILRHPFIFTKLKVVVLQLQRILNIRRVFVHIHFIIIGDIPVSLWVNTIIYVFLSTFYFWFIFLCVLLKYEIVLLTGIFHLLSLYGSRDLILHLLKRWQWKCWFLLLYLFILARLLLHLLLFKLYDLIDDGVNEYLGLTRLQKVLLEVLQININIIYLILER